MNDADLINSIIETLKRYGYNADRSNLDMIATLAMEDHKDMSNRIESIVKISCLTNKFDEHKYRTGNQ